MLRAIGFTYSCRYSSCGQAAAAFDGRADLRFQVGMELRAHGATLAQGDLHDSAVLLASLNEWLLPLARRFRANGMLEEEGALQSILRRVADLTEQPVNPRHLVSFVADSLSKQGRTLQGLPEEDVAFQQFLTRAAQQAKLNKAVDSASGGFAKYGGGQDRGRRGVGRDDDGDRRGRYRGSDRGSDHGARQRDRGSGRGGNGTSANNLAAVQQRLSNMYAGAPNLTAKCFGCHHLGAAVPVGTMPHVRFANCPHRETVAASLNM